MVTITIGKAPDNDFVVNNAHVSRHHARLVRENSLWVLEDLDSSNGTFVNGSQIIKKKITPTDSICLGDDCMVRLEDLLKSKNDYSEEFKKLKKIYDDYTKEKVRIQSSNQFKTRLFQSLPFALPGIVGMIIGYAGQSSHQWMMICLLLAVFAPVAGIYMGARQSAKIPHQLQELNNQFKIDYVCPKCGTFLGEIPWESLKNKRHCPISTCQAKWVDDDL